MNRMRIAKRKFHTDNHNESDPHDFLATKKQKTLHHDLHADSNQKTSLISSPTSTISSSSLISYCDENFKVTPSLPTLLTSTIEYFPELTRFEACVIEAYIKNLIEQHGHVYQSSESIILDRDETSNSSPNKSIMTYNNMIQSIVMRHTIHLSCLKITLASSNVLILPKQVYSIRFERCYFNHQHQPIYRPYQFIVEDNQTAYLQPLS